MKKIFTLIAFVSSVLWIRAQAQEIVNPATWTDADIEQILQRSKNSTVSQWETDFARTRLKERRTYYQQNPNKFGQRGAPPVVNASSCVNPGFETGGTTGWTFYSASNSGQNLPCNTCVTGATDGNYWVVNRTGTFGSCGTPGQDITGTDGYSGQPAVSAGGGNYALLLNNACAGYKMEKAVYTFVVGPSSNIFTFMYSVALQSGSHPVNEQPYFHVDFTDMTTGSVINCTQYDATAPTSGALNGWSVSSADATVYTYPWTSVGVDLTAPAYSGHTMAVTFIVSDCNQGGHFGYAYIDAMCGSNIITTAHGLCVPSGGPGVLQGPPGFATYNWINSSGTTVGTSQNLTTTVAGTYTLNTTSVSGCPAPSMFATLTTSPDPVPSFSTTQTACGTTLTATDGSTVSSGSILNWSWNWGDGSAVTNAASGANQVHNYATPGTYTITLKDSTSGSCTATLTKVVTVVNGPNAVFTSNSPTNTPQCYLGNNVQFTNTSTSTGGATITGYNWDFGDGTVGTSTAASPNTTHAYTSCGNFVVTLTVNTSACNATTTQTVQINPSPTEAFSVPPVCAGVASAFTSTTAATPCTSTSYTYVWNYGDGTAPAAAAANPTHTYASAAGSPYAVTVTVTAVGGCSVTATANATVNVQPTASFSVAQVCQGSPSVFDAGASAPAASINNYNWSFGGVAPNTDNVSTSTDNHTYSASGTFPVSLTVTAVGGCTATATGNAVVNPMPVLSISSSTVCNTLGTTLTNNTPSQASFSTWNWNMGDGSGTNATAGPVTYTYATAGVYTVVLTATTTSGCAGTASTTAVVHPNPVFSGGYDAVCAGSQSGIYDYSTLPAAPGIHDSLTTWTWSFGDGFDTTTNVPEAFHTYASCNTYSISYTVTTNFGCGVSAGGTYTVFCNPTVAAPASFSLCPGTPVTTAQTTFTTSSASPALPTLATIYYVNYPNPSTGQTATHGGIPLADTVGQNAIPNYTAIAKNLTCNLLVDTVEGYPVSAGVIGTNTLYCYGPPATFTISVYPTPYLSHMPNDSLCANQTLAVANFTACPANSTVAWTNSNPAIGLAATGTTNIGSFVTTNATNALISGLITATATANGCIGPDSTFTIFVKPLPTMTATSFSACPTSIIPAPTIIVTNPAAGVHYNWTVTNNAAVGMPPSGTGTPASYTAPANGTMMNQTGQITYTPTLNGCVGKTDTAYVTVYPTPVVSSMPNLSYCPKTVVPQINFNSTPTNTLTIFTYSVSGSIVGTYTAPSIPSFTAQNTGCSPLSNLVTVVSSLNGCPSPPISFSIAVQPNPVASFSYAPACDGKPILFTDLSSVCGGVQVNSWQWDMSNNGSVESTSQNPSYTVTPAGTDSVKLTVATNSNPSCSSYTVQPVIVYPNPVVSFTGVTKGCAPFYTTLIDSSKVATGSIVSWNWNLGNGSSSGSSQPAVTYNNTSHTQPQYYSVSLTVTTDKGCTESLSKNNFIEAYPVPQAGFSYNPPDADITEPVITFFNTSLGASTYTPTLQYGANGVMYNLGDTYLPANSSNNVSYSNGIFNHTYSNPDDADVTEVYTVTQWVINMYGCKDSTTNTLEIKPIVTFYIPNSFTPNGDGLNDNFKGTGMGIKDSTYNLWIYDRWGLLLYHSTGLEQSWNGSMNGDASRQTLQEDVYVWKVSFSDILNKGHNYQGIVTLIK
ncbi:MAG: PKD domain-containing protein [Bacteroidetes bacterium]|nr:PKD domain-containing protein [Bacteroidota bacterium]